MATTARVKFDNVHIYLFLCLLSHYNKQNLKIKLYIYIFTEHGRNLNDMLFYVFRYGESIGRLSLMIINCKSKMEF